MFRLRSAIRHLNSSSLSDSSLEGCALPGGRRDSCPDGRDDLCISILCDLFADIGDFLSRSGGLVSLAVLPAPQPCNRSRANSAPTTHAARYPARNPPFAARGGAVRALFLDPLPSLQEGS